MSIEALIEHYRRVWREDASHEEVQALVEALLEHHDPDHLRVHFELLRDQEHSVIHASIRAAFERHGPPAEAFLVQRLPVETAPELREEALQILGLMRSESARGFAREATAATDESLRHRGVVVLGWVGTIEDMGTVLRERLRHDPSPLVRGDAATACRQVWQRFARAKDPAIEILGEALEHEHAKGVIASIVVSLQGIMKQRLGLRELRDEAEVVGDAKAAKDRALRSVARWKIQRDEGPT